MVTTCLRCEGHKRPAESKLITVENNCSRSSTLYIDRLNSWPCKKVISEHKTYSRRRPTVVYATIGYVTSDNTRHMFAILELNCLTRPPLDIMSPSRA